MKVFWWQCGLHIEPESKEETEALTLLSRSLKMMTLDEAAGGELPATFEIRNLRDKNSVATVEAGDD